MDNCICDLNDDHLLNNPKVLPCGFSACLKCLKGSINTVNGKLDCKCCKQIHIINDPEKLISNVKISNMIKNNINTFTLQLCDKLQLNLSRLQSINLNSELLINKYFEFIKEDVLIKIESLKSELDQLGDRLIKLLDTKCSKTKLKLEKFNSRISQNLNSQETFIQNCKQLLTNKQHDETNSHLLEENMYLCQDNCKKIELYESELNKILASVTFKPSELKIDPILIGSVEDSLNDDDDDINDYPVDQAEITHEVNLSEDDFKVINLAKKLEWPCGMCNLSKSEIALTDNVNNEVVLLNTTTYEVIKHIKSIGDVKLTSPFGICYDDKDTIYLCDGANHRLLILNKSFTRVKKIIGKKGSLIGEFNFPLGVCYFNGFIYVSDHDNKRVQVLTHNGDYVKEIKLVKNPGKRNVAFAKDQDLINSPWCLCVAEDTIAVLDFCENVYFYNFDGHLRHIIQDNTINSICLTDGYLFTHSNDGTLACYEKSTRKSKYDYHLYELISKKTFNDFKAYSAFIILNNEKLLISFGEKKFLGLINPKKFLN